jgi:hypothetical protein
MTTRTLYLKCRECGRILPATTRSGSSSIRGHAPEHPGIQVTYQLVLAEASEAEELQGRDREVLYRR